MKGQGSPEHRNSSDAAPAEESGRSGAADGRETLQGAALDQAALQAAFGDDATAPQAALRGDLGTLSVPELLAFLKANRRTGTLMLTSSRGIGALHLRRGLITGATSPGAKSLGEVLLEGEYLRADQLRDAVEGQSAEPELLLGAVLLALGLIAEDRLKDALKQQLRSALAEMLQWPDGQFTFETERQDEESCSGEAIGVELDAQELLMEIISQADEAAVDRR